jgi:hypothetical protein
MRAQLEQRLEELREEYASGQRMLADLETKQATLRETLLRISGAIQVLEEEIAKAVPVGEQAGEPSVLHATNGGMVTHEIE